MENLHFIPDSGFMNSFIKAAEEISGKGQNRFIIYKGNPFKKPSSPRFVKHKEAIVAPFGSGLFKNATKNLNQYKRIFFHFLSNEMCDFILKNNNLNAKFYWAFWGADLYMPPQLFKNEIYDELSINYFNHHDSFVSTGNYLFDQIKHLKRKLTPKGFQKNQLIRRREAIKRLDYFLHYNKSDHELLLKLFETKANHLPFFYFEYDYSKLNEVNELNRNSINKKINLGNDIVIQLGHSASLTNNHFSLIEQLSILKNHNCTFVCPLSYGDKRYAKEVTVKGKNTFGEKFIPLNEYLNKEDYAALLNRIDISFMNHLRTEAAGNIFMMLAMGKKVFLNNKSNLYKFLIEKGVKVFDINSNETQNFSALTDSINEEMKKNNYNIISSYFSEHEAYKNLKNVFQTS